MPSVPFQTEQSAASIQNNKFLTSLHSVSLGIVDGAVAVLELGNPQCIPQ